MVSFTIAAAAAPPGCSACLALSSRHPHADASRQYHLACHHPHVVSCVPYCHLQGMEQTSYVVEDFVREWKRVWEAVACLPNFESDIKGRLLVDLANEPDSQWQGWQVKNGKAGFTDLYLGAMDAIWSMTPGAPIFVCEGGGQGAYAGLNWVSQSGGKGLEETAFMATNVSTTQPLLRRSCSTQHSSIPPTVRPTSPPTNCAVTLYCAHPAPRCTHCCCCCWFRAMGL